MRRFWILLLTEIKAWRQDPITILGGLIAPTVMLVAFGLLFTGELSFPIAIVNLDDGPWGAVLVETCGEVLSPFDQPYYRVSVMPEAEAMGAFEAHRIEGVWVIPPDFSERLDAGQHPSLEMHFNNYIDDRAKNHRLYSAEILYRFYEKIGQPGPPLAMAEVYPLPEMVDWFSVIGIGLVLLSVTMGGMFNIFGLTYKEQVTKVTLEFGMSPWPLALVLLPKVILALAMGLLTGTVLMGILALWAGVWPGRYLGAVYLLSGLVALFWISITLVFGLRARHYMAGAITAILMSVVVFFVGGGLAPVRYYPRAILWFAWLFPNTHAIDPLRELVLFQTWPGGGARVLATVAGFAGVGLAVGLSWAGWRLRRLD
jgi:ABC-2 type transport system permease protein